MSAPGGVPGLGGSALGGLLQGGLPGPGGGGVSAPGGCAWSGGVVCLTQGGVPGPGGCIPACTEADTLPPLWTEFLTHACENITLAQLRCGR